MPAMHWVGFSCTQVPGTTGSVRVKVRLPGLESHKRMPHTRGARNGFRPNTNAGLAHTKQMTANHCELHAGQAGSRPSRVFVYVLAGAGSWGCQSSLVSVLLQPAASVAYGARGACHGA